MIYIVTQRDPFFIDSFLQEFDKFDIPYIVLDLPSFNKGFASGLKKALLLYGPMGFLKLLLFYCYNRPTFSLKNMISYRKYADAKSLSPILKSVRHEDVILSLSAPCRIPSEIIPQNVRKFNIHCGKLPQYAGMMPIFWQIFDGSECITITIHDLAEEIDSGYILKEYQLEIGSTLFETSLKAKRISAQLFYDLLGDVRSSEFSSGNQSDIALQKFPTKQDIRIFRSKKKLI